MSLHLSLSEGSHSGENVRGRGWVEFLPESLCQKSFGVARAEGEFVDGKLDGEATITFVDDSFLVGNFRRGVLHGLARAFWCRFGSCDFFELRTWSEPRHLKEVSERGNKFRFIVDFDARRCGVVLKLYTYVEFNERRHGSAEDNYS